LSQKQQKETTTSIILAIFPYRLILLPLYETTKRNYNVYVPMICSDCSSSTKQQKETTTELRALAIEYKRSTNETTKRNYNLHFSSITDVLVVMKQQKETTTS
jgi:hypothetical protein